MAGVGLNRRTLGLPLAAIVMAASVPDRGRPQEGSRP
jgi:hypothetical protein